MSAAGWRRTRDESCRLAHLASGASLRACPMTISTFRADPPRPMGSSFLLLSLGPRNQVPPIIRSLVAATTANVAHRAHHIGRWIAHGAAPGIELDENCMGLLRKNFVELSYTAASRVDHQDSTPSQEASKRSRWDSSSSLIFCSSSALPSGTPEPSPKEGVNECAQREAGEKRSSRPCPSVFSDPGGGAEGLRSKAGDEGQQRPAGEAEGPPNPALASL